MRPIDADALMEKYGEPCHSFADVIENMPTLDLAPRWISVKDRLPDVCFETNTYKETDDVFAIDDVGDKCVGRFAISKYDGSYTFYGYTADAEERDPLIVTHWLDCMPEPPKEG